MKTRIGHGFDVHRFGEPTSEACIHIGGVVIPHSCRLLAHSDGDVLIHALCDALLGAVGLGDIGQHFPDTDARFRGIDSRQLLRETVALLSARGWRLGNADITLIAEAPKFSPHKAAMRANLAQDIGCDEGQINIKATTTEGLGYSGRKEGIACHAVVLLQDDQGAE